MALADEIASISRRLTLLVGLSPFGLTSAGSNVLGVRVSKSFDSPVPVATITVDTIHASVKRGDRVIIDVGYNGLRQRIFTGYVIDRAYGTTSSDINCAGQLYQLSRMNDLTERSVDGVTVKAAIDALFTAAGAPGSFVGVDTSEVPATFTFGTPTDYAPFLPPGNFMGMLQALMDVEGCVVMENGAGGIKVYPSNGLPAGMPFKSFTTATEATARIIDGRSREDPDYLRTRIHATGATLPDGQTLTVTATLVGGLDLVQPPFAVADTYIDMEWSNHLIDTQAKLNTRAIEVLGQYARVPRQLPLETPGDPQLELGQTLGVTDPYIGIDASTKWFVHGIEHVIDGGGYVTNLDLRGGDEFGGEININPIACFTWTIEREVFGTQVYAFLSVDATCSYDPDGTIASYAWAGNQDAADDPAIDSQTTATWTVRLDPAGMAGDVDNIIVTLTVTDNDGLTGTSVQTIPINASSSLVQIPAVFSALNNNFSCTPDGGQNWNDQAITNADVTAAAPPDGVHTGYGLCSGGASGDVLYRTTDYCATAPTQVLAAVGSAFVDLAWDPNDATTVWALTAICNLYVSTDYGATFALIVNWRTSMDLSTIIGKRVVVENDGYVWVYGGTGVTNNGRPFIGRFRSGEAPFGFASVFGGELATDLGSGTTALAIVDAANKHDGGGLTIIMENYNASDSGVRPIYHCADPFLPTGWQRATGLTAGLTTAGRYVVPDSLPGEFHAAFANRDVWSTTDGVAWTQAANVMPVGVTPNRCIWLQEELGRAFVGTYLIAAEDAGATVGIYKSYDSLATVGLFRPATGFATWPASALGKDLAVGPATGGGTARVLVAADPTGTNNFGAWMNGDSVFTNKTFTSAQSHGYSKVRTITKDIWFLFFWGNDSTQLDDGVCYRTVDAGTTWDEPYAVPAVGRVWQDIQRDAGGRLWGLSIETGNSDHMEIWYNDDPEGDGAWTESKDNDAATSKFPVHIACHPTDQNIIAVWARTGALNRDLTIWYTTDRGANWSSNTVADRSFGTMVQAVGFKMVATNNRLVLTHFRLSDSQEGEIITSDDYGATWDSRKVFSTVESSAEYINGIAGVGQTGRLFVSIMYSPSAGVATPEVWRSIDYGTSWSLIAGASIDNAPPQATASHSYEGGIAYDPITNSLYLFGDKDGTVNSVVRLSPADSTGSWEDLTDSIGSYNVPFRSPYSIAVIPTS